MNYCSINKESPEYMALVDGLRNSIPETAEWEADRDIMEHGGIVRSAAEVKSKLSNEMFSLVKKEKSREAVLDELQSYGLVSRVKAPAKYQTLPDTTLYTIPKVRNIADLAPRGTDPGPYGKNLQAYDALYEYLDINDIDWIKVKETKDAYWVHIPTTVQQPVIYSNQMQFYRPGSVGVMENVLDVNGSLYRSTTNNNRAREIASKLSTQLGIDYDVINASEAYNINSKWNGEKAFFTGDKVYFVGNGLNASTAFHEFSHPLIRSISINNPELFNKLFTELSGSQEGRDILERVRTDYKELDENSGEFKEEALTFSLQYAAEQSSNKIVASSPFAKFLSNIFYAIKKLLRNTFGTKVNVSNLDQNTTINDLADMLIVGDNFKINIEDINYEDVISYYKDEIAQADQLLNVDDAQILSLVNSAFDKVSRHINDLKNREDYNQILDTLTNEFSSGELDAIRKNLKGSQTRILEVLDNKLTESEIVRERVNALVKTIGHVNNLTTTLKDQLNIISKDINNQDNLQRAAFIESTLDYWRNFLSEADEAVPDKSSPVYAVLQSIKANIATSDTIFNSIQERAATDALIATTQGTAENIDKFYKEERDRLEKKGAPKAILDKLDADYEANKITPDKIKAALKGKLKDISMVGAFMEGYTYNPDPVVGGLAKYVKDAMLEVETQTYSKFNDFLNTVSEDLKAVNYNPNSEGKLGRDIGFKDRVGFVNDSGEFETKEVWRFLNEFQGHDVVADEYRFKIKEAGDKYAESQKEEDKKALYDLEAAWRQHKIDFYHQKYTPDFYKTFELFEKDDIGKEAGMIQQEYFRKIQMVYNTPTDSKTELEILDEAAALKREFKRKSDVRDVAGRMKTGMDLEIAKRLQEFKEASKDFYESNEIPGAFQNALKNYETKLAEEGLESGSERWIDRRDLWIEKNTTKTLKPEFWENRKRIIDDIQLIIDQIPQDERAKLNVEEANNQLREVMFGFKDESGQPVGSEMSPDRIAIVKNSQEKLIAAREQLRKLSGLTPAEQDELSGLFNLASKHGTTPEMIERISALMAKKAASGIGHLTRVRLIELYEELEDLQSTVPTDDYVDVVNSWLSSMDTGEMFANWKLNAITKDTESIIRSQKNLDELFKQSAEFEAWYKENHIKRKRYDRILGEEVDVWERIYVWNTIQPKSQKFYETTELKDKNGEVYETITGKPSSKYSKSKVKSDYLTAKVVGKTVDNAGHWLPKTVEQGAKDGRYRNDAYYRMASDNPTMFRLLEKMKNVHVKNQEGADNKSKLWYDMPRYRKDLVEKVQSKNPFSRMVDSVKLFWQKRKDAVESGFNASDDYNLVKLDLFNTKSSGIPITGLANLDTEEVSTDIAYTMMRYMASLNRQNKLAEIAPTVRAIQATVNDEKNFPIVEKALKNRTLLFQDDKKKKYVRAQAVNNYIEREFEGQYNAGLFADHAFAQNASNFLFGKASFAFLALNVPSAIKNAIGAKFQGMVEAAAGKYLSPSDLIQAEKWATHTAMVNSAEVYKKGTKSLNVQLADTFDFEQGKAMGDLGKSLSRTVGKDTAHFIDRLSDFRKWTQYQSLLQTGGAMLIHQKIQQGDKWISYMDAWELNEQGKIQLKAGIDPAWGITYDEAGNAVVGDKFKAKKAEMQRVLANLNGAMAREDSPEAQRYLLFRYVSFMRKWFTGQFMNRFGHSGNLLKGTATGRVDYQLGDTKEGYYITMTKLFTKTVKQLGRNLPYMTGTEKGAALRFITEVGSLVVLGTLMPILFGYDDDDEDRFKKLAAKSGPLPGIFVQNDPAHPFHFGGWLSNHTLLMILQVRGENEQFLPIPGFGVNDYMQYTDIKTLALGPTIKTYYDIAKDLGNTITGDEDAHWQREAGPFNFDEKGDNKVWKHLWKTAGVTGSTIDPVTAMRNYDAIQNK